MLRVARGLVATAVVLAVTGGGASALAEPGSPAPAGCKAGGTLAAAALPTGYPASICDHDGIVVTDGAAAVRVPARGLTVSAAVLTVSGDQLLTVARSAGGSVTIRRGLPARTAPDAPAASTACSSSAFVDLGYQVGGTYGWHYNGKSAPGNVAGSALANLKTATSNITSGKDDCGIAGKPKTAQAFAGTTSKAPGITSDARCGSGPDQVNVTGWKSLTASGVLAVTCTYYNGSHNVIDSDAAINTKFKWVTAASGCSGAYDLQGVMTHERGHTFGLGHPAAITANKGLTMYPSVASCDFSKRTLGRGDLLGLFKIYGKS